LFEIEFDILPLQRDEFEVPKYRTEEHIKTTPLYIDFPHELVGLCG